MWIWIAAWSESGGYMKILLHFVNSPLFLSLQVHSFWHWRGSTSVSAVFLLLANLLAKMLCFLRDSLKPGARKITSVVPHSVFWTLCGNAYDYSFVVSFSVSIIKKRLVSLCDNHWKTCVGIKWAGMFWSLMMLMSTVSPTWRAVTQAFVSTFFMYIYTRTKPVTMQWRNFKPWKIHKYGGLCLEPWVVQIF